jgi:DNA-binding NarL/FixJ family response regulator
LAVEKRDLEWDTSCDTRTGVFAVRALVVDDDDTFRALVSAILGETADVVEQAAEGAAAVALARGLHPDVVVMDISMPGMNGIDAAATISRENPGARIVFLSGTETEAKLAAASDGGTYAVIHKSANDLRAELLAAVRGSLAD